MSPPPARPPAIAPTLDPPDLGVPAAPEQRLRTVRANLDALADRAPDLFAALDAWTRRLDDHPPSPTNRAAADAITLPADITSGDLQRARPITIEGVSPPWLFLRIAQATPPTQNGHRPRLQIVQADPLEFLDGLACADMTAVLADERVRCFVGPDASAQLRAFLESRFDTIIAGPLLRNPSLRTPAAPAVEQAIAAAAQAQGAEMDTLTRRVAAAYGPRDPAWWRRRFTEALSGSGAPLRVLIPTCRYSTFVRHSADDMAGAVRAIGHEARIVIEPDACSRLSSVAYTRAFAEFDPDLVLLINYTRASLGAAGSPRVPFVCWVQDAMPQLFDKAAGAASGPLDFLAGYTVDRLLTEFGHPRERSFHTSVGVCPRKFHAAPVSEAQRARFECEIAYVGHQSETVDAFHNRQAQTLGQSPAVRRVMELVRERVLAINADPMTGVIHARLDEAVRSAIREVSGAEPDPRMFAVLLNQYAMPLADRAYRHETLEWAATIADRHGWRLRLFGRGWDRHPTLARFAQGEVAHGEDLRACYQAAAVHLHAAMLSPVHQRPIECALSGGLPLVRFNIDEVHSTRYWLLSRAAAQAAPDFSDTANKRPHWWTWNHAPLMEYASLCGRLGLPIEPGPELQDWAEAALRRIGPLRPENLAHWLYAGLAESCFATSDQLEEQLAKAIDHPERRRAQSTLMASRMRERMTTDAIATKLLAFIRDNLGGVNGSPDPERVWPGVSDKVGDVSGLNYTGD